MPDQEWAVGFKTQPNYGEPFAGFADRSEAEIALDSLKRYYSDAVLITRDKAPADLGRNTWRKADNG